MTSHLTQRKNQRPCPCPQGDQHRISLTSLLLASFYAHQSLSSALLFPELPSPGSLCSQPGLITPKHRYTSPLTWGHQSGPFSVRSTLLWSLHLILATPLLCCHFLLSFYHNSKFSIFFLSSVNILFPPLKHLLNEKTAFAFFISSCVLNCWNRAWHKVGTW